LLRFWTATLSLAFINPLAMAQDVHPTDGFARTAEAARGSEIIAHVHIDAVDASWDTVNGYYGIWSRVTATVIEPFKGTPGPTLQFMVIGGVVGDRAVVASHQPRFTAGEEVVVFLFRGGAALFPFSEVGKWTVRRGAGTPRAMVGSPGRGQSGLPLLELRDRIGQIVGQP
jgi:hypothetical protein